MKHKRKKLIVVIVVVLLVVLIVNAVLTWGIMFECDGGFKWSMTSVFEEVFTKEQTGEIRLGENPGNPIFGIPLIFLVYGIEPPPYVICLRIIDKTESLANMFVESITIEYIDGLKMEHDVDWEREFYSTSLFSTNGVKSFDIPAMGLRDKLPVTVERRKSCDIKLVGHFVKKDGDTILDL